MGLGGTGGGNVPKCCGVGIGEGRVGRGGGPEFLTVSCRTVELLMKVAARGLEGCEASHKLVEDSDLRVLCCLCCWGRGGMGVVGGACGRSLSTERYWCLGATGSSTCQASHSFATFSW